MKLLWLVLGLYANSAIAQGTCYSFDWHGYSNQFQASFTIPEWSRDPGVDWGTNITDEMSLTAVIKGPSGQSYSYANSDIMASGGVGVSTYTSWDIMMVDWNTGLYVYAVGTDNPTTARGTVTEALWGVSDPGITERGYWTITPQVPEPGADSLMGLGFLAWVAARLTRRCT
jgi:hypothetical protein